ncbi:hypothetical protein QJQ45_005397 [Haematococcus lacustris]|nr:hypothetical protein QJQ45_005397 [Haematococcus lacustris]
MDSACEVYRHQLRACVHRLRLLPSVFPGPPDLDGRTVHNKLFVCGLFSDELESHVLSVLNLRVTCRGSHVLHTSPERICTWELPAAATDIQVSDLEGGWVQLSLGCSDGGLLLARLLLPRLPGSGPEDITQTHLPTDSASGGERLQPQLRLHSGAISCVDTQPDTQAILTVGVDGAICVLPPDLAASAATDGSAAISAGEGPGHHAPWRCSRGGLTSLTAGRWADTNVFITVHPARPNLCATGAGGGCLALWDLRLASQPLMAHTPPPSPLSPMCGAAAGPDVWEVRFDTSAASMAKSTAPGMLFCTNDGTLGQATFSPTSSVSNSIAQCPHSINSFDVDTSSGPHDLLAVSDAGELVYVVGRTK